MKFKHLYFLIIFLLPFVVEAQNNAAFKKGRKKASSAHVKTNKHADKELSERQQRRLEKKKLGKDYEFNRSKQINKGKVRRRMERHRRKAIKKARQKALRNRPPRRKRR